VRRLFAVKGRSPSKALPLLVSDRIMAEWVAEVSPIGHRLMSTLWPGALTIVLPRNPDFYSQALGGGQTVAIREPAHGLVRDIIHRLGEPLTGTSANRSGSRAAVSAQEAAFQLGQMVALVIDGGKIGAGSESTIVDITMPEGPTITRMGAVSREEVQRAAGVPVRDEST
jgi:L-threonylcarbamoyladenylate synthase